MSGPRRTTCLWCDGPLTHAQVVRRRTYCSRSCVKEHWHAEHRGAAVEAGRKGWQPGGRNHQAYVRRLKAALEGCRTKGDAYRRGYGVGYRVGYTRAMARTRRTA